jgi:hypothetical protein
LGPPKLTTPDLPNIVHCSKIFKLHVVAVTHWRRAALQNGNIMQIPCNALSKGIGVDAKGAEMRQGARNATYASDELCHPDPDVLRGK